MITKTVQISVPFPREFDRNLMETETKTWLKLSNEGKVIVEQILAAEERTKSKKKKKKRNSNLGFIANDPIDGFIESTSPVLDELELKTVHKDEEGDW